MGTLLSPNATVGERCMSFQTDIYKSAWPYKTRLQTEWVQFDDDRIHQREVFDSGTHRLRPPHRIPPSPHSPRLIVPSPIRTIIGESLRVGELVGKVCRIKLCTCENLADNSWLSTTTRPRAPGRFNHHYLMLLRQASTVEPHRRSKQLIYWTLCTYMH